MYLQDLSSINSSKLSASSVYHRSILPPTCIFVIIYFNIRKAVGHYKTIRTYKCTNPWSSKINLENTTPKPTHLSINITGIFTMNIKTSDNAKINCYTRVNATILTTCRIFLASPFCRAYRDFKCKRCLHCVV